MTETYFNKLNYTLANEDTSVELAVLPSRVEHAVVVASSGARVVPLLAREPRLLTCVDVSPAQLSLTRLRLAAVRALDHESYLALLGYPCASARVMSASDRKACFWALALPDEDRQRLLPFFEHVAWDAIAYSGTWEHTMRSISGAVRRVLGHHVQRFFSPATLGEHLRYLARDFPLCRWRLLILALGNAAALNALLYKGQHPRKNIPESYYRFYRRGFQRLFEQSRPQENFFLQMLFLGRLEHHEGLPLEADASVFAAAKSALARTELRFQIGDVIELIRTGGTRFDFLSLSDTPSYYPAVRAHDFLQEIKSAASPAARVVPRYYFRVPARLDTSGWARMTDDYRQLIEREKTQIYRIDVWERRQ
jgi:S-adenosylmethionine-diacylglycerol 3-amino-3-carboxypropyl transferase